MHYHDSSCGHGGLRPHISILRNIITQNNNNREMICLQHFYNISTTNPKWQVVTSYYCWDKKVILLLVSNSNQ